MTNRRAKIEKMRILGSFKAKVTLPDQPGWGVTMLCILFPEDGVWIAASPYLGFVQQGKTLDAALRAFESATINQAATDIEAGKVPFEDFKPAELEIQEMWDLAMQEQVCPVSF